MKEIKVKSEHGDLILQKSTRLVGLKTNQETQPDEIAAQVIPNLGGFEIVTLNDKQNIDDALDHVRSNDKVDVGTHIYFAKGDNRPVVPTGIIFVTFDGAVGPEESKAVFDAFGLNVIENRENNMYVVEATANSANPLKAADQLQALNMVISAEPDLDIPMDQYFTLPRDGFLSHQWHLKNDGRIDDANFATKPGADSKVTAAWARLGNLGSPNIRIAVIDNGFDLNHPDLRGKSVSPLNVTTNSTTLPVGARYGNHATPCASVAVAAANGSGIVGAAPSSQLIPIHGLTFSRWLTERMFNHCINSRADVISCSWGTIQSQFRPSSLHEAAIKKAMTQGRNGKGCVVLFAAGNENVDTVNYYGQIPGVIAVGASNSNDTHSFYSNRGPQISVVAPSDGGWPILAARASWDTGIGGKNSFYVDGRNRSPFYKHFGGTSSATPLVAGICALILSANPDLTSAQVKSILERTADKIGGAHEYDSRGHSRKYGYGRVNADNAVKEAIRMRGGSTTTPTVPPISVPTTPPNNGGSTWPPTPTVPTPAPPTPTPPTPTPPTPTPPTPTTPSGGTSNQATGLLRFSVKNQVRSGFGLQVNVYRDFAGVLKEAEKLERIFNLPVIIDIQGSGSSALFKVILGNYSTADAARQQIGSLKAAGYSPFVRSLS